MTRIYYGLLKCAWDTSLPQTSWHMEDPFQSSIPELSANPRHQKSFGQGGSGLVSKRLLQQLFLPRFNALFVTLWDDALRRESMWWTSTKTSRLRPQNCTPRFILRRNGHILLLKWEAIIFCRENNGKSLDIMKSRISGRFFLLFFPRVFHGKVRPSARTASPTRALLWPATAMSFTRSCLARWGEAEAVGHRNAMIFLKQMASAFLNVSDGCGPVFLSASSFCWLFLGSPLGSLGVTPPKMRRWGGPLGAAHESGEDARQHLRDDWWCGQADQGPILFGGWCCLDQVWERKWRLYFIKVQYVW